MQAMAAFTECKAFYENSIKDLEPGSDQYRQALEAAHTRHFPVFYAAKHSCLFLISHKESCTQKNPVYQIYIVLDCLVLFINVIMILYETKRRVHFTAGVQPKLWR